jgi:hypothetical protein
VVSDSLQESLESHELTTVILSAAAKVVASTMDRGAAFTVEPSNTRELTEAEYYARRCGFSLAHLLQLVCQIEQMPGYIKTYKRIEGGDRVSDLIYHWENYLVRGRGLEDRALHLVGSVLHLGLASRHVSFSSIRQNVHVRHTQLGKALDRIHAVVNPLAKDRNQVVHENQYLAEDFHTLEFWKLVRKTQAKARNLAIGRYLTELRSVVPARVAEVEAFIDDIGPPLFHLFSALLERYPRMARRLEIS